MRRMSIGFPCSSDMTVAMGSAVYGTPHMLSKGSAATLAHMISETCAQARRRAGLRARLWGIRKGLGRAFWARVRACGEHPRMRTELGFGVRLLFSV